MASQRFSYAHGGCETPLIYQTIGARFDEAAYAGRTGKHSSCATRASGSPSQR